MEIDLRVLDLGCGNGIFGIYLVLHLLHKYHNTDIAICVSLTMLEYDTQAVNNCLLNLRTLTRAFHSPNVRILAVTALQSDMFSALSGKFDIILANLPQTPFQSQLSRVDKNGGTDALKYNRILIEQYQDYLKPSPFSLLVMLYSHMCQP